MLYEIKPGIYIDKAAVIMATCAHDPEIRRGTGPIRPEQFEHYTLTLTLANGAGLVLTNITEIVETCKWLEIKAPSEWRKAERVFQGTTSMG